MNILTAQAISKTLGIKQLFSDVTLGIHAQDRIGVIGINGCGKSTFMKVLARIEPPDSGSITARQDLNIEYLPQNPVFDESHTVLEHIFSARTEVAQLVQQYVITSSGSSGAINEADCLSLAPIFLRFSLVTGGLNSTLFTNKLYLLAGRYCLKSRSTVGSVLKHIKPMLRFGC